MSTETSCFLLKYTDFWTDYNFLYLSWIDWKSLVMIDRSRKSSFMSLPAREKSCLHVRLKLNHVNIKIRVLCSRRWQKYRLVCIYSKSSHCYRAENWFIIIKFTEQVWTTISLYDKWCFNSVIYYMEWSELSTVIINQSIFTITEQTEDMRVILSCCVSCIDMALAFSSLQVQSSIDPLLHC